MAVYLVDLDKGRRAGPELGLKRVIMNGRVGAEAATLGDGSVAETWSS